MIHREHFLGFITETSYRLFGNFVPNFSSLKKDYAKSGIKVTYELYAALSIFTVIITAACSFAVSLLLQSVLGVSLARGLIGAIILTFVASMTAAIIAVAYPVMRVNKNKNEIDSNLIYTVGYMSVLSAGGISIDRLFERVVEVEPHLAIKDLALRFTTNIKLFGADTTAALKDTQMRSASETFSKLLLSINSTTKTSGDLKSLLAFETNNLLALKREQLKKRLAGLVALAELYVTAMVMAPVTFIIMITLLSVLGNSSMSLSPVSQLNLIVFFGIPVICIIFILILDSALPKED
ncbi:MAG: type II secretion system F family protein [Candidatus Bathyarchaeota archaeon]|nr:type II secretion system F family protein [Candidatus Bathyarchaeota archaeon]